MPIPQISQEALDLIVASEIGSRALYEKKYHRPEWPGAASGVTVGIGYDLGYASPEKIKADWSPLLPPEMVAVMVGCSGITGESAKSVTAVVRDKISVPWDAANHVFMFTDIVDWSARVCNAIPGADKLHPHCLGALTSLAYNRGASFKTAGDRYTEMRAVRAHIMAGQLTSVDDDIRAMKRLWGPELRGLWIRRDAEADLWNKGLQAPSIVVPPPPPTSKENPPPLAPVEPSAGGVEATTTGVAGSAVAGVTAAQAGLSPTLVGCLIAAGIIVTVAGVLYYRWQRQQPVLARAKG